MENKVRLNNQWGRENKMEWKPFNSLNSLMMPACGIVGGTMYTTGAKEAFWGNGSECHCKVCSTAIQASQRAGTLHRPADLQPIECRRRAADLICREKFICRVEALLVSGVVKAGRFPRTLSAQRFQGISTTFQFIVASLPFDTRVPWSLLKASKRSPRPITSPQSYYPIESSAPQLPGPPTPHSPLTRLPLHLLASFHIDLEEHAHAPIQTHALTFIEVGLAVFRWDAFLRAGL